MDFIDYIYENINIHNSLIIYDAYNSYIIDNFINNMINKNYPISHINLDKPIDFLETKYRMLVVPHTMFNEYLSLKKYDLSNINVIFCINKYNYIIKVLSSINIVLAEDINVFKIN
jgi:hypothetical protein